MNTHAEKYIRSVIERDEKIKIYITIMERDMQRMIDKSTLE